MDKISHDEFASTTKNSQPAPSTHFTQHRHSVKVCRQNDEVARFPISIPQIVPSCRKARCSRRCSCFLLSLLSRDVHKLHAKCRLTCSNRQIPLTKHQRTMVPRPLPSLWPPPSTAAMANTCRRVRGNYTVKNDREINSHLTVNVTGRPP